MRQLALGVAAGLFVVGCSSPSTSANSMLPPGSSTTMAPSAEATTTPTSQPCASGDVTVPWQPGEYETSACVTSGSKLVLTFGGGGAFGGTWPGPPNISNGHVLTLTSSTFSKRSGLVLPPSRCHSLSAPLCAIPLRVLRCQVVHSTGGSPSLDSRASLYWRESLNVPTPPVVGDTQPPIEPVQ